MLRRLQGLLSSNLDERIDSLNSVRLYLAMGVGLLLVLGAVNDAKGLLRHDPVAWRMGVAAATAGLLGATYASAWARAHVRGLLWGLVALVLTWQGTLLALNDFAPELCAIYFTVALTGGTLFGVAYSDPRATGGLVSTVVGVAAAAAYASDDPAIHPAVFLACLSASAAVMTTTALIGRRLTESLWRSEQLHAAAEAAGGIGSWSVHLGTESTWSSPGLRALLGTGSECDEPVLDLRAYIHPDDLPAVAAALRAVRQGDLDEHAVTFRLSGPGRERTMRGVLRAERDADGAVVRIVAVGTDVTAQAAHQAELVEALARAEAAARLKEAILANMSHEIRTPLTAVIGYAELLAEIADAEMVPLVRPIVGGGQRLMDTLNSVLDLARLEAEGASLALRPVELGVSAEAARAALAETAARAGLTLGVEADADIWAAADAGALGRVLDNLVSNAIRFTDSGGVTLRLRAADRLAIVEVIDTGRGMSKVFADRAVEPFVQESAGDARSHEGSGLGLSIVSRLVDAMGGELHITSAPGAGTTVRVALPLASPEAIAAPSSASPAWVARRRLATIAARA